MELTNNGINNKETLQKYLLTAGILESSIQDSLDMIVRDDGKLSDVAVRRKLDLKIPSVMKKPNPVDYVFKDIAKLDTQNPIVDDILKQTQKIDLDNLSSIKDTEIRERLDKLRNDRYYKNDNRPPPPGIPTPTPGPNDDHLIMTMIFLTFHLHHFLLIILIHLIYHQLQILHHCLIIANQILRMMIMMTMISILIFLKKI